METAFPMAGVADRPQVTAADDALLELAMRTEDARGALDTMAQKAEPQFRPIPERFRDLHARHYAALEPMLAARGLDGVAGGSVAGTVTRAVLTVRAMFDSFGPDVIISIRKIEAQVQDAFAAALASGVTAAEATVLQQMQAELDSLLDEQPDDDQPERENPDRV